MKNTISRNTVSMSIDETNNFMSLLANEPDYSAPASDDYIMSEDYIAFLQQ
jgi:hypothetical protein